MRKRKPKATSSRYTLDGMGHYTNRHTRPSARKARLAENIKTLQHNAAYNDYDKVSDFGKIIKGLKFWQTRRKYP